MGISMRFSDSVWKILLTDTNHSSTIRTHGSRTKPGADAQGIAEEDVGGSHRRGAQAAEVVAGRAGAAAGGVAGVPRQVERGVCAPGLEELALLSQVLEAPLWERARRGAGGVARLGGAAGAGPPAPGDEPAAASLAGAAAERRPRSEVMERFSGVMEAPVSIARGGFR